MLMRVVPNDQVANFVVRRADGHELSLSSVNNSLIEWKGGMCVTDHGPCYGVGEFIAILNAFVSAETL